MTTCNCCGSTDHERQRYVEREADGISPELKNCPFCNSTKCCMCDMGDDVGCVECEGDA